ncbi:MAG TPA: hypothetical protein VGH37_08510 [Candidatus Acidoferrum sp.]
MAYARFGRESDEDMICQYCNFNGKAETVTKTRSEMLKHMEEHRRTGDKVRDDAFENLRADLSKDGDVIKT